MPTLATAPLGATLRIHQPAPGVFAYYDGRIPDVRAHALTPNWLDDGGFVLGIASFAIVSGAAALVYDTHLSIPHARRIRSHLEGLGVRDLTVVLSHHHKDHIAGNAVFADCEIVANRATAELMEAGRAATAAGDPPIDPLVMPTTLFSGATTLTIGGRTVDLVEIDAHSRDGTVLHLRPENLLLAGDTLEDTVTYVVEPDRFAAHLGGLAALAALGADRILPNHGDEDRIAGRGYGPGFIDATRRYVDWLIALPDHPDRAGLPLRDVVADDLAAGSIIWFEPYETVHRDNVARVLAGGRR